MIKINLITKAEQQQLDALRSVQQFFQENYIRPDRSQPMEPLIFHGFIPMPLFKGLCNGDTELLLRKQMQKIYRQDQYVFYSEDYFVETKDMIFLSSQAWTHWGDREEHDEIRFELRFECKITDLQDYIPYTKSNLFAKYHQQMIDELSKPIRNPQPAEWFTMPEGHPSAKVYVELYNKKPTNDE